MSRFAKSTLWMLLLVCVFQTPLNFRTIAEVYGPTLPRSIVTHKYNFHTCHKNTNLSRTRRSQPGSPHVHPGMCPKSWGGGGGGVCETHSETPRKGQSDGERSKAPGLLAHGRKTVWVFWPFRGPSWPDFDPNWG